MDQFHFSASLPSPLNHRPGCVEFTNHFLRNNQVWCDFCRTTPPSKTLTPERWAILKQMASQGSMAILEIARGVMGSRTYYDMAAFWPYSDSPLAPAMNDIPKVIFSSGGIKDGNVVDRTTRALADAKKGSHWHGQASHRRRRSCGPGLNPRWPAAIINLRCEMPTFLRPIDVTRANNHTPSRFTKVSL
jgi:hypothetical protein